MKSLGITGGIGAGKSESARFLESAGIPVLDTDTVARDLVQPGRPALSELVDAFGPEFLNPQGTLDRAALGLRIFEDPAARHRLEAILHPRIFGVWTRWIQDQAAQDRTLCAIVIPLLYEKDYGDHFDAVVAVACTGVTQRLRLRKRGWSDETIDRRLAAQIPMAEKLNRADYGVWSEGCVEVLRDQLRTVLESEGLPGIAI
jgi:dephospho-CoA kinase